MARLDWVKNMTELVECLANDKCLKRLVNLVVVADDIDSSKSKPEKARNGCRILLRGLPTQARGPHRKFFPQFLFSDINLKNVHAIHRI